MQFSKRNKYLILCLLIVLNFIIRILSVPHEIGSPDEFTMHSLANSLSAFGQANWWAHPSSIFGFYPYSYASATPFIFSGISQLTGNSMELIAWIFPALLGIFVMLSTYLLAGQIRNDDLFKFIVAFIVSLSPGVLNYLTWQISARGFIIALLPFFLYLLLKIRTFSVRCSVLTIIFFILLMATHHLYIFSIVFILSFIIITIFYKLEKYIKLPHNIISIALFFGILIMFSIPFFTGLFIQSSRYDALHLILENNIRYGGPTIFFAIGGLNYLIFKRDREFGEWFILLITILFIPFLYIDIYAKFVSAILIGILTGIGIVNMIKLFKKVDRKYTLSILIIILIIFVSFSTFYQHWRTKTMIANQWYMEETTFDSGLWVKENIENKRLVGNNDLTSTRIFATSEVPTLVMPETDISYGFFNASDIKTVMNSPFSVQFYSTNPYILITKYHETESDRWHLETLDIDRIGSKTIIDRYNLSYYIENAYDVSGPHEFIRSLEKKRDLVYSNGRVHIWCLDCIS